MGGKEWSNREPKREKNGLCNNEEQLKDCQEGTVTLLMVNHSRHIKVLHKAFAFVVWESLSSFFCFNVKGVYFNIKT